MDYKERLRKFNNTQKYMNELVFLGGLINYEHCNCLDYGCGLGTAMYHLQTEGYDVNDYCEYRDNFNMTLPDKHYDHVYFMHSFAHISNPGDVLRIIRGKYPTAYITIITPNFQWLQLQSKKGYTADPTVYKHYTQTQLRELLESVGYKVLIEGQFGEQKYGFNERIFIQAKYENINTTSNN